MYDTNVPERLKNLQEWFGSIIAAPLVSGRNIAEISPSGRPISEEAAEKIRPSATLKPFERIQIYNQQYWWRLINNMQESFPFVVRIFGYSDFNETIAVPYLKVYPSHHWSLDALGEHLPKWITDNYTANDKGLVYDASVLDLAHMALFFKPLLTPLAEDQFESTIYLQPHATLHEFPYDLIPFREKMMEQTPDHWLDNLFPDLKKGPHFYILYRSIKGHTTFKSLPPEEFALLQLFQKGATIDMVCEWIETKSPDFRKVVEENLQKWFQEWTIRGILTSDATH